jgi:hypothetical protein
VVEGEAQGGTAGGALVGPGLSGGAGDLPQVGVDIGPRRFGQLGEGASERGGRAGFEGVGPLVGNGVLDGAGEDAGEFGTCELPVGRDEADDAVALGVAACPANYRPFSAVRSWAPLPSVHAWRR